MPKTTKRRTCRTPLRKKRRALFQISLAFFTLLICLVVVAGWWFTRSSNPLGGGVMYDETYQVTGAPSINADLINQVLDFYSSPARGKGQTLYDLGVKYGIDPVYALTFFMQESRFGTTGVAQVTLSLGNIRATPGYVDYDGYRKYKTWEEGFEF
jgi:hypothetical protein